MAEKKKRVVLYEGHPGFVEFRCNALEHDEILIRVFNTDDPHAAKRTLKAFLDAIKANNFRIDL